MLKKCLLLNIDNIEETVLQTPSEAIEGTIQTSKQIAKTVSNQREIKKAVKDQVDSCVKTLQEDLTSKGYTLSSRNYNFEVNLANKNVIIKINYDLAVTKDNTQRFEGFEISIPSNAYKLVGLSTSLLNYEARYGDSESLTFMALYPHIRVNKLKQGDSSTVYILTDRNTGDVFGFAVRSYAWPAGYKL